MLRLDARRRHYGNTAIDEIRCVVGCALRRCRFGTSRDKRVVAQSLNERPWLYDDSLEGFRIPRRR
jgi:hypothetical protein